MAPAAWWDQPTLDRLVRDLVAAALKRLRPGSEAPAALSAAHPSLGADGLALDSLERVDIAQTLATFFRLYDTGEEERLLTKRDLAGWVEVIAGSLAEADQHVTVSSGGTTGTPKPVTHSVPALRREAAEFAQVIGPRRRVLALVPGHHIYGLIWTVFVPEALGAELVDMRAHSPAALPRLAGRGDLIVAVPALWRLASRADAAWPGDVGGVTATAPLPADVEAALTGPDGLAWLLQVYGSTETAGIGWRWHSGQPYRLLADWQGERADARTLWRTAPPSAAGPVVAPDSLAWVDARHLYPAGRADGAVQVAGVNVDPRAVEACLAEQPGVAEAAVKPMTAAEGERLKAFIVPTADAAEPAILEARLAAALARAFVPEACPRSFRFGSALPRDSLGKVADWPAFAASGDTAP